MAFVGEGVVLDLHRATEELINPSQPTNGSKSVHKEEIDMTQESRVECTEHILNKDPTSTIEATSILRTESGSVISRSCQSTEQSIGVIASSSLYSDDTAVTRAYTGNKIDIKDFDMEQKSRVECNEHILNSGSTFINEATSVMHMESKSIISRSCQSSEQSTCAIANNVGMKERTKICQDISSPGDIMKSSDSLDKTNILQAATMFDPEQGEAANLESLLNINTLEEESEETASITRDAETPIRKSQEKVFKMQDEITGVWVHGLPNIERASVGNEEELLEQEGTVVLKKIIGYGEKKPADDIQEVPQVGQYESTIFSITNVDQSPIEEEVITSNSVVCNTAEAMKKGVNQKLPELHTMEENNESETREEQFLKKDEVIETTNIVGAVANEVNVQASSIESRQEKDDNQMQTIDKKEAVEVQRISDPSELHKTREPQSVEMSLEPDANDDLQKSEMGNYMLPESEQSQKDLSPQERIRTGIEVPEILPQTCGNEIKDGMLKEERDKPQAIHSTEKLDVQEAEQPASNDIEGGPAVQVPINEVASMMKKEHNDPEIANRQAHLQKEEETILTQEEEEATIMEARRQDFGADTEVRACTNEATSVMQEENNQQPHGAEAKRVKEEQEPKRNGEIDCQEEQKNTQLEAGEKESGPAIEVHVPSNEITCMVEVTDNLQTIEANQKKGPSSDVEVRMKEVTCMQRGGNHPSAEVEYAEVHKQEVPYAAKEQVDLPVEQGPSLTETEQRLASRPELLDFQQEQEICTTDEQGDLQKKQETSKTEAEDQGQRSDLAPSNEVVKECDHQPPTKAEIEYGDIQEGKKPSATGQALAVEMLSNEEPSLVNEGDNREPSSAEMEHANIQGEQEPRTTDDQVDLQEEQEPSKSKEEGQKFCLDAEVQVSPIAIECAEFETEGQESCSTVETQMSAYEVSSMVVEAQNQQNNNATVQDVHIQETEEEPSTTEKVDCPEEQKPCLMEAEEEGQQLFTAAQMQTSINEGQEEGDNQRPHRAETEQEFRAVDKQIDHPEEVEPCMAETELEDGQEPGLEVEVRKSTDEVHEFIYEITNVTEGVDQQTSAADIKGQLQLNATNDQIGLPEKQKASQLEASGAQVTDLPFKASNAVTERDNQEPTSVQMGHVEVQGKHEPSGAEVQGSDPTIEVQMSNNEDRTETVSTAEMECIATHEKYEQSATEEVDFREAQQSLTKVEEGQEPLTVSKGVNQQPYKDEMEHDIQQQQESTATDEQIDLKEVNHQTTAVGSINDKQEPVATDDQLESSQSVEGRGQASGLAVGMHVSSNDISSMVVEEQKQLTSAEMLYFDIHKEQQPSATEEVDFPREQQPSLTKVEEQLVTAAETHVSIDGVPLLRKEGDNQQPSRAEMEHIDIQQQQGPSATDEHNDLSQDVDPSLTEIEDGQELVAARVQVSANEVANVVEEADDQQATTAEAIQQKQKPIAIDDQVDLQEEPINAYQIEEGEGQESGLTAGIGVFSNALSSMVMEEEQQQSEMTSVDIQGEHEPSATEVVDFLKEQEPKEGEEMLPMAAEVQCLVNPGDNQQPLGAEIPTPQTELLTETEHSQEPGLAAEVQVSTNEVTNVVKELADRQSNLAEDIQEAQGPVATDDQVDLQEQNARRLEAGRRESGLAVKEHVSSDVELHVSSDEASNMVMEEQKQGAGMECIDYQEEEEPSATREVEFSVEQDPSLTEVEEEGQELVTPIEIRMPIDAVSGLLKEEDNQQFSRTKMEDVDIKPQQEPSAKDEHIDLLEEVKLSAKENGQEPGLAVQVQASTTAAEDIQEEQQLVATYGQVNLQKKEKAHRSEAEAGAQGSGLSVGIHMPYGELWEEPVKEGEIDKTETGEEGEKSGLLREEHADPQEKQEYIGMNGERSHPIVEEQLFNAVVTVENGGNKKQVTSTGVEHVGIQEEQRPAVNLVDPKEEESSLIETEEGSQETVTVVEVVLNEVRNIESEGNNQQPIAKIKHVDIQEEQDPDEQIDHLKKEPSLTETEGNHGTVPLVKVNVPSSTNEITTGEKKGVNQQLAGAEMEHVNIQEECEPNATNEEVDILEEGETSQAEEEGTQECDQAIELHAPSNEVTCMVKELDTEVETYNCSEGQASDPAIEGHQQHTSEESKTAKHADLPKQPEEAAQHAKMEDVDIQEKQEHAREGQGSGSAVSLQSSGEVASMMNEGKDQQPTSTKMEHAIQKEQDTNAPEAQIDYQAEEKPCLAETEDVQDLSQDRDAVVSTKNEACVVKEAENQQHIVGEVGHVNTREKQEPSATADQPELQEERETTQSQAEEEQRSVLALSTNEITSVMNKGDNQQPTRDEEAHATTQDEQKSNATDAQGSGPAVEIQAFEVVTGVVEDTIAVEIEKEKECSEGSQEQTVPVVEVQTLNEVTKIESERSNQEPPSTSAKHVDIQEEENSTALDEQIHHLKKEPSLTEAEEADNQETVPVVEVHVSPNDDIISVDEKGINQQLDGANVDHADIQEEQEPSATDQEVDLQDDSKSQAEEETQKSILVLAANERTSVTNEGDNLQPTKDEEAHATTQNEQESNAIDGHGSGPTVEIDAFAATTVVEDTIPVDIEKQQECSEGSQETVPVVEVQVLNEVTNTESEGIQDVNNNEEQKPIALDEQKEEPSLAETETDNQGTVPVVEVHASPNDEISAEKEGVNQQPDGAEMKHVNTEEEQEPSATNEEVDLHEEQTSKSHAEEEEQRSVLDLSANEITSVMNEDDNQQPTRDETAHALVQDELESNTIYGHGSGPAVEVQAFELVTNEVDTISIGIEKKQDCGEDSQETVAEAPVLNEVITTETEGNNEEPNSTVIEHVHIQEEQEPTSLHEQIDHLKEEPSLVEKEAANQETVPVHEVHVSSIDEITSAEKKGVNQQVDGAEMGHVDIEEEQKLSVTDEEVVDLQEERKTSQTQAEEEEQKPVLVHSAIEITNVLSKGDNQQPTKDETAHAATPDEQESNAIDGHGSCPAVKVQASEEATSEEKDIIFVEIEKEQKYCEGSQETIPVVEVQELNEITNTESEGNNQDPTNCGIEHVDIQEEQEPGTSNVQIDHLKEKTSLAETEEGKQETAPLVDVQVCSTNERTSEKENGVNQQLAAAEMDIQEEQELNATNDLQEEQETCMVTQSESAVETHECSGEEGQLSAGPAIAHQQILSEESSTTEHVEPEEEEQKFGSIDLQSSDAVTNMINEGNNQQQTNSKMEHDIQENAPDAQIDHQEEEEPYLAETEDGQDPGLAPDVVVSTEKASVVKEKDNQQHDVAVVECINNGEEQEPSARDDQSGLQEEHESSQTLAEEADNQQTTSDKMEHVVIEGAQESNAPEAPIDQQGGGKSCLAETEENGQNSGPAMAVVVLTKEKACLLKEADDNQQHIVAEVEYVNTKEEQEPTATADQPELQEEGETSQSQAEEEQKSVLALSTNEITSVMNKGDNQQSTRDEEAHAATQDEQESNVTDAQESSPAVEIPAFAVVTGAAKDTIAVEIEKEKECSEGTQEKTVPVVEVQTLNEVINIESERSNSEPPSTSAKHVDIQEEENSTAPDDQIHHLKKEPSLTEAEEADNQETVPVVEVHVSSNDEIISAEEKGVDQQLDGAKVDHVDIQEEQEPSATDQEVDLQDDSESQADEEAQKSVNEGDNLQPTKDEAHAATQNEQESNAIDGHGSGPTVEIDAFAATSVVEDTIPIDIEKQQECSEGSQETVPVVQVQVLNEVTNTESEGIQNVNNQEEQKPTALDKEKEEPSLAEIETDNQGTIPVAQVHASSNDETTSPEKKGVNQRPDGSEMEHVNTEEEQDPSATNEEVDLHEEQNTSKSHAEEEEQKSVLALSSNEITAVMNEDNNQQPTHDETAHALIQDELESNTIYAHGSGPAVEVQACDLVTSEVDTIAIGIEKEQDCGEGSQETVPVAEAQGLNEVITTESEGNNEEPTSTAIEHVDVQEEQEPTSLHEQIDHLKEEPSLVEKEAANQETVPVHEVHVPSIDEITSAEKVNQQVDEAEMEHVDIEEEQKLSVTDEEVVDLQEERKTSQTQAEEEEQKPVLVHSAIEITNVLSKGDNQQPTKDETAHASTLDEQESNAIDGHGSCPAVKVQASEEATSEEKDIIFVEIEKEQKYCEGSQETIPVVEVQELNEITNTESEGNNQAPSNCGIEHVDIQEEQESSTSNVQIDHLKEKTSLAETEEGNQETVPLVEVQVSSTNERTSEKENGANQQLAAAEMEHVDIQEEQELNVRNDLQEEQETCMVTELENEVETHECSGEEGRLSGPAIAHQQIPSEESSTTEHVEPEEEEQKFGSIDLQSSDAVTNMINEGSSQQQANSKMEHDIQVNAPDAQIDHQEEEEPYLAETEDGQDPGLAPDVVVSTEEEASVVQKKDNQQHDVAVVECINNGEEQEPSARDDQSGLQEEHESSQTLAEEADNQQTTSDKMEHVVIEGAQESNAPEAPIDQQGGGKSCLAETEENGQNSGPAMEVVVLTKEKACLLKEADDNQQHIVAEVEYVNTREEQEPSVTADQPELQEERETSQSQAEEEQKSVLALSTNEITSVMNKGDNQQSTRDEEAHPATQDEQESNVTDAQGSGPAVEILAFEVVTGVAKDTIAVEIEKEKECSEGSQEKTVPVVEVQTLNEVINIESERSNSEPPSTSAKHVDIQEEENSTAPDDQIHHLKKEPSLTEAKEADNQETVPVVEVHVSSNDDIINAEEKGVNQQLDGAKVDHVDIEEEQEPSATDQEVDLQDDSESQPDEEAQKSILALAANERTSVTNEDDNLQPTKDEEAHAATQNEQESNAIDGHGSGPTVEIDAFAATTVVEDTIHVDIEKKQECTEGSQETVPVVEVQVLNEVTNTGSNGIQDVKNQEERKPIALDEQKEEPSLAKTETDNQGTVPVVEVHASPNDETTSAEKKGVNQQPDGAEMEHVNNEEEQEPSATNEEVDLHEEQKTSESHAEEEEQKSDLALSANGITSVMNEDDNQQPTQDGTAHALVQDALKSNTIYGHGSRPVVEVQAFELVTGEVDTIAIGNEKEQDCGEGSQETVPVAEAQVLNEVITTESEGNNEEPTSTVIEHVDIQEELQPTSLNKQIDHLKEEPSLVDKEAANQETVPIHEVHVSSIDEITSAEEKGVNQQIDGAEMEHVDIKDEQKLSATDEEVVDLQEEQKSSQSRVEEEEQKPVLVRSAIEITNVLSKGDNQQPTKDETAHAATLDEQESNAIDGHGSCPAVKVQASEEAISEEKDIIFVEIEKEQKYSEGSQETIPVVEVQELNEIPNTESEGNNQAPNNCGIEHVDIQEEQEPSTSNVQIDHLKEKTSLAETEEGNQETVTLVEVQVSSTNERTSEKENGVNQQLAAAEMKHVDIQEEQELNATNELQEEQETCMVTELESEVETHECSGIEGQLSGPAIAHRQIPSEESSTTEHVEPEEEGQEFGSIDLQSSDEVINMINERNSQQPTNSEMEHDIQENAPDAQIDHQEEEPYLGEIEDGQDPGLATDVVVSTEEEACVMKEKQNQQHDVAVVECINNGEEQEPSAIDDQSGPQEEHESSQTLAEEADNQQTTSDKMEHVVIEGAQASNAPEAPIDQQGGEKSCPAKTEVNGQDSGLAMEVVVSTKEKACLLKEADHDQQHIVAEMEYVNTREEQEPSATADQPDLQEDEQPSQTQTQETEQKSVFYLSANELTSVMNEGDNQQATKHDTNQAVIQDEQGSNTIDGHGSCPVVEVQEFNEVTSVLKDTIVSEIEKEQVSTEPAEWIDLQDNKAASLTETDKDGHNNGAMVCNTEIYSAAKGDNLQPTRDQNEHLDTQEEQESISPDKQVEIQEEQEPIAELEELGQEPGPTVEVQVPLHEETFVMKNQQIVDDEKETQEDNATGEKADFQAERKPRLIKKEEQGSGLAIRVQVPNEEANGDKEEYKKESTSAEMEYVNIQAAKKSCATNEVNLRKEQKGSSIRAVEGPVSNDKAGQEHDDCQEDKQKEVSSADSIEINTAKDDEQELNEVTSGVNEVNKQQPTIAEMEKVGIQEEQRPTVPDKQVDSQEEESSLIETEEGSQEIVPVIELQVWNEATYTESEGNNQEPVDIQEEQEPTAPGEKIDHLKKELSLVETEEDNQETVPVVVPVVKVHVSSTDETTSADGKGANQKLAGADADIKEKQKPAELDEEVDLQEGIETSESEEGGRQDCGLLVEVQALSNEVTCAVKEFHTEVETHECSGMHGQVSAPAIEIHQQHTSLGQDYGAAVEVHLSIDEVSNVVKQRDNRQHFQAHIEDVDIQEKQESSTRTQADEGRKCSLAVEEKLSFNDLKEGGNTEAKMEHADIQGKQEHSVPDDHGSGSAVETITFGVVTSTMEEANNQQPTTEMKHFAIQGEQEPNAPEAPIDQQREEKPCIEKTKENSQDSGPVTKVVVSTKEACLLMEADNQQYTVSEVEHANIGEEPSATYDKPDLQQKQVPSQTQAQDEEQRSFFEPSANEITSVTNGAELNKDDMDHAVSQDEQGSNVIEGHVSDPAVGVHAFNEVTRAVKDTIAVEIEKKQKSTFMKADENTQRPEVERVIEIEEADTKELQLSDEYTIVNQVKQHHIQNSAVSDAEQGSNQGHGSDQSELHIGAAEVQPEMDTGELKGIETNSGVFSLNVVAEQEKSQEAQEPSTDFTQNDMDEVFDAVVCSQVNTLYEATIDAIKNVGQTSYVESILVSQSTAEVAEEQANHFQENKQKSDESLTMSKKLEMHDGHELDVGAKDLTLNSAGRETWQNPEIDPHKLDKVLGIKVKYFPDIDVEHECRTEANTGPIQVERDTRPQAISEVCGNDKISATGGDIGGFELLTRADIQESLGIKNEKEGSHKQVNYAESETTEHQEESTNVKTTSGESTSDSDTDKGNGDAKKTGLAETFRAAVSRLQKLTFSTKTTKPSKKKRMKIKELEAQLATAEAKECRLKME